MFQKPSTTALNCLSDSTRISRRSLLKAQSKAALVFAAASSGLFRVSPLLADQSFPDGPDLSIARGGPGPATRAAVEALGGMTAFVRPGQRVVIKPNMSFAHPPERATNTHPDVVRELAVMCTEAGAARVRILDHPLQSAEMCLVQSGIQQACAGLPDVSVHTMSAARFFREVVIPQGEQLRQTQVMEDVLAADVLIAAPVAKSHSATGVSLAMKGMLGLILDRGILHRRFDLHTAIVDLTTLLMPDLTVVDATRVLSTNGPFGPGKVLQEDTVIASRDVVAADAMTVRMFEWYGRRIAPRQVRHILLAHDRGLGTMDLSGLQVAETTA
ncbi:MAG: DUF362 domain-containing protein [Desulfovibrionales bacterium]|nr:MAG: DUF362 domain-containing protein [Desulfovibrionales bacterium]